MSDPDKIEVGDLVTVDFPDAKMSNATVLYIPVATGDSWHIRTKTGTLFYVQQFETIELLSKKA